MIGSNQSFGAWAQTCFSNQSLVRAGLWRWSVLIVLITAMLMALIFASPAWADETDTQTDNEVSYGIGDGNDVNFQLLPDNSFIYDTPISALAGADSYYNNQMVQVTGEVVGDRINAEFDPDHCWITLYATDDSNTEVQVFLTKTLTESIDSYGVYGRQGTIVQVAGTFYLVCPEHEGTSDIHAHTLNVVSPGQVFEEPFVWGRFLPGILLTLLGLGLMALYRYLQERLR